MLFYIVLFVRTFFLERVPLCLFLGSEAWPFFQLPRLQSVQHQVSVAVSVFRQSLTRTKTPASVKECMSRYENASSTNRYILMVRSFFFYKSRSRFSVDCWSSLPSLGNAKKCIFFSGLFLLLLLQP